MNNLIAILLSMSPFDLFSVVVGLICVVLLVMIVFIKIEIETEKIMNEINDVRMDEKIKRK